MGELLDNLRLFTEAGTVEFIRKHSDVSPAFSGMFNELIARIREDLNSGNCVHDWNRDYTAEMRSILKLYEDQLAVKPGK